MQNDELRHSVRHLIDYDDSRASAPHEHTAAAIAGAGLLFWALVSRSRTRAVLHAAIGGALLLRSAGGRDGLRRWSRQPAEQPPKTEASAAPSFADLPM
ncbi:hypothetical protein QRO11_11630 [Paracidovorax citrulli]|uniref:Uncharacterized protein n=2 Tax=Paracidovorax citrulli TaxID=80869 RepID=A1TPV0_PARC0|nr:hypothetical protein [Paracidovorax citrulli]ABM32988.1 hypothetical protein Aave_2413 [Paracidovorax citrulli AAC00-1]ATG93049.1 hypothetical protein CQB05_02485 [Paracidovorax citrulli]MVT36740.1 hypothetical protein [Paracidovorax citrulli]PVY67215.1 hypothetical protein C8E08_4650 [Paracidovorax citrulli]QCX09137.1 hypothetical protein APS58_0160 [Paracidovorax citrulli]